MRVGWRDRPLAVYPGDIKGLELVSDGYSAGEKFNLG